MRRGRLAVGSVLLGLSILPWAVAPFVPLLGLSAGRTAAVVAALIVGAEVVGVLAALTLGREAFAMLRRRWLRRKSGSRPCTS